jgi:hypothetical protein
MSMSATPRSARLSSPTQVVAILVASAVVWVGIVAALVILFVTVFIPATTLGGRGQIPKDFPVYPGAQLQSAFATSFGDCTTVDATWSTSAPASTVTSFYQNELASGAWTLTDSRQHVGAVELYFQTASGLRQDGIVTVSSQPFVRSSTQISLEMYKSKRASTQDCQFVSPAT